MDTIKVEVRIDNEGQVCAQHVRDDGTHVLWAIKRSYLVEDGTAVVVVARTDTHICVLQNDIENPFKTIALRGRTERDGWLEVSVRDGWNPSHKIASHTSRDGIKTTWEIAPDYITTIDGKPYVKIIGRSGCGVVVAQAVQDETTAWVAL